MKILLTAINAKYIHSSLAVRSLNVFASKYKEHIDLCEYTINNDEDFILREIYGKRPDVICFSCYIWNINIIKNLADSLKKVLPNSVIVCGGPEVSYDCRKFLEENSAFDIVLYGEGEKPFLYLTEYFLGKRNIEDVSNAVYRKNGEIFENSQCEAASLDEIPFVYNDLSDFENKIIYYETQRGCPYSCQFCLSSVEKGVRFLSLERVFNDLDFFLKNNVKQVKFVDRTFNCNIKHAMAIWKYIMDNDNGVTNFHMEIEAHIITDEIIDFIKNAREGLFQFEIGVQSTNPLTLEAVRRNPDFESLKEKIIKIKNMGNIHVHLDLIAGLPYEGYESFGKSFDDVYGLRPQQLQLGFLKLLKGSGLRRDSEIYGICYNSRSPYEVLYTKWLTFEDVLKLKNIEELVETYYNSGKTETAERYAVSLFKSPFEFYEIFSKYWEEKGYFKVNHTKAKLYDIFYDFCYLREETKEHIGIIGELLKCDMLMWDNLKNFQSWVDIDLSEEFKQKKRDFYNNKELVEKYISHILDFSPAQLSRMCFIEKFDFDLVKYFKWGEFSCDKTHIVLFDYQKRDIISNKVKIIDITEDF